MGEGHWSPLTGAAKVNNCPITTSSMPSPATICQRLRPPSLGARRLAMKSLFRDPPRRGFSLSEIVQDSKAGQLGGKEGAALAEPRFLMRDETTSSVDTRTERLIQKAFDTLLRGREDPAASPAGGDGHLHGEKLPA